jgi:hypothetical protein
VTRGDPAFVDASSTSGALGDLLNPAVAGAFSTNDGTD